MAVRGPRLDFMSRSRTCPLAHGFLVHEQMHHHRTCRECKVVGRQSQYGSMILWRQFSQAEPMHCCQSFYRQNQALQVFLVPKLFEEIEVSFCLFFQGIPLADRVDVFVNHGLDIRSVSTDTTYIRGKTEELTFFSVLAVLAQPKRPKTLNVRAEPPA